MAATVAAFAITFAACGSSGGPKTADVNIHTFMFRPTPARVARGTTVRWTNRDQILHTVTAGTRDYDPTNSGSVTAEHKTGQFDSPLDGVGKSFSYTFRTTGTYHYFCSRHPGMEADVEVT